MAYEDRLRVGQVAHAAGVNVQTLHYYERRGLLRAPQRTPSGYRVYHEDTVDTVRGIKRAQALGFTLGEIRQLMTIQARSWSPGTVIEIVTGKLREIDGKIRDLRLMRRSLQEGVERCKCGGDLSRCDGWRGLGAEEGPRVSGH